MKNQRISAAWDCFEPDAAADARMLEAILARSSPQTRKVNHMKKTMRWLAPAAACLALAIACAGLLPKLTAQREKIQQITLPAMLAGQKVEWEALSEGETEPKKEDDWFVFIQSGDGLELKFGSADTKIVGTLADGRKVRVATEELSRKQSDGEKGAVSISIGEAADLTAIAVGATILNFEFTDETGATVAYRCYIEAIE